jgi:dephospho-CoA kinase
MLIVGLTGSIATGKSTVSACLSAPPHCLPVIDADLLARQVVEPGTPGYRAIVNYFGSTTPDLLLPPSSLNDRDGRDRPLNRLALGKRVFGDSEDRKRDRTILNGIVHPAVRWEIYKALLYYYIRGYQAVVLDVPLLFEIGVDIICGTVIVVAVKDPTVQMRRLRMRDPHLSLEDAENRVKSQTDVRVKARQAEFRGTRNARGIVLWNDGDKSQLEREVHQAVKDIRDSSPRWWASLLLLVPPIGVTFAVWNLVVNFRTRKSWERHIKGQHAKL